MPKPDPLSPPLTALVISTEIVIGVSVPPAPMMVWSDWKVPDMLMMGSSEGSKVKSKSPDGACPKQTFAQSTKATIHQHRFFNKRLIIIMGCKDAGRMENPLPSVKRSIKEMRVERLECCWGTDPGSENKTIADIAFGEAGQRKRMPDN